MTMDFNPPKILSPDDFLAMLVLLPGDDAIRYRVYRSGTHAEVSDCELVVRLRGVLKHLEAS